ncbi:MAG TPA: glycoside hydrolase family 20 zincin-like fold domain-containing protein [Actinopolymorphaceae bacterium]
MTALVLAPRPRSLESHEGHFELADVARIVTDVADPYELLFVAQRLKAGLRDLAGKTWEIAATKAGPAEEIGAVLRLDESAATHDQGYRLEITPEQITISGRTVQGLFYGVATLNQIIAQRPGSLPCLTIVDHPDFENRGVMLDISRDKVPTLETMYDLIDKLAAWKINQVQLYTEHTFAYREHRSVWEKASPFTGEEIMLLDAYCKANFIELVPNQNLFGHMHRWLQHPEYAHLAEVEGDFETPWGTMPGPFSVSPVDPGSLELARGLLDELLPHFSSKQVNVGCDETFDLGQGRSAEAVAERGVARVYLDYVLDIYREVTARGRTMQFWGDIIEKHAELIPELPKDSVALAWGYEASHPFGELAPKYAAAGVPFYVCPGTSSWCSIAGRTDNALGNLRNAAEAGLANGAIGYLNTDWGDRGHWQVLPVSYLGILAGASYSWAYDANRELDVAAAVSLHAFVDRTGTLGSVAYDLGNTYRQVGFEPGNSSVLFWLLQTPLAELTDDSARWGSRVKKLGPDGFRAVLESVDAAVEKLGSAQSRAVDAELVRAEFENTARMLRHAARRGLVAVGAEQLDDSFAAELEQIITAYESNWSARNRPGGLPDSLGRLEALRSDYT